MKNKYLLSLVISFLLLLPLKAESSPPTMPAKIGGTVTVDGVPLTQDDTGYTFEVTRQDGTSFDPVAEYTDVLNTDDWYMIDIQIYDAIEQPGGANPGETVVIHIYRDNGDLLSLISPVNGEFTLDESGSITQIDLAAVACTPSPEVCDGEDNNCDGVIDEGFAGLGDACSFGIGACENEGTIICSAGGLDTECSAVAGDPAVNDATCDGIDDDCDGSTDEDYATTPTECGVGACASTGQLTCQSGSVVDSCQAGEPTADDASCDGTDNDCDGATDEDYVVIQASCGVGACASTGQLICQNGSVVDSCQAGEPTADDATCDGIDDDCDGSTDEDYATAPTECGVGACASAGQLTCQSGSVVDSCQAGEPAVNDATCDGVDNDCDGSTDEDYVVTQTSCGIGACASTGQLTCQNAQEVDSCQAGEPAVNDATCDGVDNDCDGSTDEDYATAPTECGVGACASAGQLTCQNGQEVDSCQEGDSSEEICNNIDDDCDGSTDEELNRQCGATDVGECQYGTQICAAGNWGECAGEVVAVDETCDNKDNNCDGSTDEDLTQTCGTDEGECESGTQTCTTGSWGDCEDEVAPSVEVCDSLDNDCDGSTDENITYYRDADEDGYGNPDDTIEVDNCVIPEGYVDDNSDCDDTDATVNPEGTEDCEDGVDNDCDGKTDEGPHYYPDSDNDGYGAPDGVSIEDDSCVAPEGYSDNNSDCDDTDADINPGMEEICDNIDNDCDGVTDIGLNRQCGTTDVGECEYGTQACEAGSWSSCAGNVEPLSEVCDNLDNNCDGSTDENLTQSCGTDEGECQSGTQTCSAGNWGECDGEVVAGDEICDGLDNDCDGETDDADNVLCFNVTIDNTESPILVCFEANQDLCGDSNPDIVVLSGANNELQDVGSTCQNPRTFCVEYDEENDNVGDIVEISIQEQAQCLNSGPGYAVANFEVNTDTLYATSACIPPGGSLVGLSPDICDSDNLSVEIDIEAGDLDLSGADMSVCNGNGVVINIANIDPGSIAEPLPDPDASVVFLVDLDLPDGVVFNDAMTVTVTLSFVRPTHIAADDFEANLQVLYYNETPGEEGWDVIAQTSDGSAVLIWDDGTKTSGTVTFETDHFSIYAASSKQSSNAQGNGSGNSTQATSGGVGGCSVTPTRHNKFTGSDLVNTLIFLLPLIVFGIRRKKENGKENNL